MVLNSTVGDDGRIIHNTGSLVLRQQRRDRQQQTTVFTQGYHRIPHYPMNPEQNTVVGDLLQLQSAVSVASDAYGRRWSTVHPLESLV